MTSINMALTRVMLGVSSLRARLAEERGQDLLEYALLGGLIAASLVAAALFLAAPIASMGEGIGRCIDFNASTTCGPFGNAPAGP